MVSIATAAAVVVSAEPFVTSAVSSIETVVVGFFSSSEE